MCWTPFYIYFYDYLDLYGLEFVWTLFKIYDSDIFNLILFYLNLWLNIYFLNNFVNTYKYPWIFADMKKIDGYLHNGYPTDMDTGTKRIFIQRVGCGGATTRTLLVRLTSLLICKVGTIGISSQIHYSKVSKYFKTQFNIPF